jgi:hypothetical protein
MFYCAFTLGTKLNADLQSEVGLSRKADTVNVKAMVMMWGLICFGRRAHCTQRTSGCGVLCLHCLPNIDKPLTRQLGEGFETHNTPTAQILRSPMTPRRVDLVGRGRLTYSRHMEKFCTTARAKRKGSHVTTLASTPITYYLHPHDQVTMYVVLCSTVISSFNNLNNATWQLQPFLPAMHDTAEFVSICPAC